MKLEARPERQGVSWASAKLLWPLITCIDQTLVNGRLETDCKPWLDDFKDFEIMSHLETPYLDFYN